MLNDSHRFKAASGFTLVEVLVVMAIVIVVAGILLAVLAQSQESGRRTAKLSNFHQLGLAGNLYHEENLAWPESAASLVEIGRIPASLIRDRADKSSIGLANQIAVDHGGVDRGEVRVSKLFDSYPGFGSWPVSPLMRARILAEGQNQGWLVDIIPFAKDEGAPWIKFKGMYHRLTLEGSVIQRENSPFAVSSEDGQGHSSVFLFSDMTDSLLSRM